MDVTLAKKLPTTFLYGGSCNLNGDHAKKMAGVLVGVIVSAALVYVGVQWVINSGKTPIWWGNRLNKRF